MLIVRFGHTFPLRVIEWMAAGILMTWGIVLLGPSDVFANPAFAGLAQLGHENTWGMACFVVGFVRFMALVINGAWRPSPHIRMVMAFVSCFFWLQISLGMFSTGVATTGIAVYPWILLADIYSTFRASADARASDEKARQRKGEGAREGAEN